MLEFCPFYLGYFSSCPAFLCSINLMIEDIWHSSLGIGAHHQQVIVRTRAPEELKILSSHHEFQEHELIPFHMTTIVLPCEAEVRCVQNPVPGTKPKRAWNWWVAMLMKLTVLISSYSWKHQAQSWEQWLCNEQGSGQILLQD
jgi:hypothetical protein